MADVVRWTLGDSRQVAVVFREPWVVFYETLFGSGLCPVIQVLANEIDEYSVP
jgi:hypothetical protein